MDEVTWWGIAIVLSGGVIVVSILMLRKSMGELTHRGAVLLDRSDAVVMAITLTIVGIAAVLWNRVAGPDVLLSTVASLAVAGIAYQRRALSRVRWSLLVTFGAGWACWMLYCLSPGWAGYVAYQSARAIGIGLFCWASWNPRPQFRLAVERAR